MRTTRHLAIAGTLVIPCLLSCDPERSPVSVSPAGAGAGPRFTAGSGAQATLLGRGTFDEAFKVKRESDGWEAEIEAKPSLQVVVQRIEFRPGGHSGWHRHPGPVFILVVSGTMTFYESDDPGCSPIVRGAEQGYLELGEHAHIGRNEGAGPAQIVVTYFAPQGAALRIDAPDPGHCPF